MQLASPSIDDLPAPHAVQFVCPTRPNVDFPAAHGTQLACPDSVEISPARQGGHILGEVALGEVARYDPAEHDATSAHPLKQRHGVSLVQL